MKLGRVIPWHKGRREPIRDPRNFPRLWYPGQRYVWDKATFTVPADVSEERVQNAAEKYRQKYAKALWGQGYEVLYMDGPHVDQSFVAAGTTDPDRRRYSIWAQVRRQPQEVRVEVPDGAVPELLKKGYKLLG